MKRPRGEEGAAAAPAASAPPSAPSTFAAAPEEYAGPSEPIITRHDDCPGTITTSYLTVTGVGTHFKTDCKPGDILECGGDARPISFVLTDTQMGLKEAFHSDIKAPGQGYVVVRATKGGGGGGGPALPPPKKVDTEESATGVSASSMRVQKPGTKGVYLYEKLDSGAKELSREELLDQRCKARTEKLL